METVQAVCEPDLGHALTTSQSIPRSFIIDRTSSSYSGFTTIISCGGFCKRKSGPTILCPINGTKWPCLRGFISTTQSTPEPAVNRSKFRNVNTFGTRAPDHNTPAIGPQFIDAPTRLRNPFRKACAKGAVKRVRGWLWQTT